MKKIKQTYLHLLIIVFTLFVTSCSDTTDINTSTNEADLVTIIDTDADTSGQRSSGTINCDDDPRLPKVITHFLITYVPNLTSSEKDEIRTDYGVNLLCVDYDYNPTNTDEELWIVSGYYPMCMDGRPKAQTPDDPKKRIGKVHAIAPPVSYCN